MNKSTSSSTTSVIDQNSVWHVANALLDNLGRMPNNRFLFLHGPAGTGKTFAAQHQGASDAVVITMTDETSAADLLGYYINRGNEGFVWQDGPAATAWRFGRRLVINEIDKANGDVESLLHTVLDGTGSAKMNLITGETLKPAEGFTCVATSNLLPGEALRTEGMKSRFSQVIEIDEPHPEMINMLPECQRKAAKASATHPNQSERISMRSWFTFNDLCKVVDEKVAATAVFGKSRANAILDSIKVAAATVNEAATV
jgi:hypothetical protein